MVQPWYKDEGAGAPSRVTGTSPQSGKEVGSGYSQEMAPAKDVPAQGQCNLQVGRFPPPSTLVPRRDVSQVSPPWSSPSSSHWV